MRAALAALALLAVPSPAHAEEPALPRYAVSLGVLGILYRGVAVEVERDLPAARISVAGGLALRSTAAGDYDSTAVGVAGEVRYWVLRRAFWTDRPRGSAVGWYAGGRLDLTRTDVWLDGHIGAQHTVAVSLLTGYRFAPWRGLEVRPYAGLLWHYDTDPATRLAPWSQFGLVVGLAAGWSW